MFCFIKAPLRVLLFLPLFVCLMGTLGGEARAETANVAVASNFRPAMEVLRSAFERETEHELNVSYGATGQFYAQIQLGAPFDVFLAADAERPALLTSSQARTYAIGLLAVWSPRLETLHSEALVGPDVRFVAMANAALAPYGAAAREAMARLNLTEALAPKLIQGNNVGQAFVFVQTGNAEIGFVALSQILSLPEDKRGAFGLVPETLYTPIRQDAVLLERGAGNIAAIDFFSFLYSDKARDIIARTGYKLP